MSDNFKFVIPATLSKGSDGEWKVSGLASSSSVDRQGEIILPQGIDATPIAKGKGFFNFDHSNDPENTIGVLDSYHKTSTGMYVEGRLFKNHARAKAVYEIMSSLNKGDTGRVGMSVEGKVLERDANNPSIIKRCLIKNVAITLNPVNQDTYADIVKSMSSGEIEFDSIGATESAVYNDAKIEETTFTPAQVLSIVEKALSIKTGAGYTEAPYSREGGAALTMESMDKEKRKKAEAKIKKGSSELFKSNMIEMMDKLQAMYPDNTRSEIWTAVQERLSTKFPDLKE